MKKLLLLVFLVAPWAFSDINFIPENHSGTFQCTCTDPYCDKSLGKVVTIKISASSKIMEIENDGVLYSGFPNKRYQIDSQTTSYASEGGVIYFDAKAKPYFGLVKIWTCKKLPG